jgi:hypothetical protein
MTGLLLCLSDLMQGPGEGIRVSRAIGRNLVRFSLFLGRDFEDPQPVFRLYPFFGLPSPAQPQNNTRRE